MVKIKAAVFRDDSLTPSLEKLEPTGPGEGEVLVKIVATGMCHSDLKNRRSGWPVATARGAWP